MNACDQFASLCAGSFPEVPPYYKRRASFAAIVKDFPLLRDAVEKAVSFTANPTIDRGPLLAGKSGRGKTHLLFALVEKFKENQRAAIKSATDDVVTLAEQELAGGHFPDDAWVRRQKWPKPVSVTMTNGSEIAHELRQTVQSGKLDSVVAKFRQESERASGHLSVLIVDDVEVMKLGDWLTEELYRIFDYRRLWSMPTVIATNFSTKELIAHFGDRISRRMLDLTELVVIE